MNMQGKFNSIRATIADAISGLLFTAVVVLVVGGTTAMMLEPAALYA
jgi:hypothetical protein